MEYIANPVKVKAFKIVRLGMEILDQGIVCHLDNGGEVIATKEMTARMFPQIGDYWVMQEDGYVYLNPKEVFERKYSPVEEERPNG